MRSEPARAALDTLMTIRFVWSFTEQGASNSRSTNALIAAISGGSLGLRCFSRSAIDVLMVSPVYLATMGVCQSCQR